MASIGASVIRTGVLSLAVVVVAMVAGMAGPAAAVGPDALLDGVWLIQETDFGVGPTPYYASVHENNGVVAAILLDPTGAEWIYAFGTRTGSTVEGTVRFADGEMLGTFTITVTDTPPSLPTLTGSSTVGGVTTPLNGTKIF